MRVAYVVGHATLGRAIADPRVIRSATALGAAGVSVDVHSPRAAASPRPLAPGVAVRRLDPRGLREAGYDVVHAFGLPAARLIATLGAPPQRIFSPCGDPCFLPAPGSALHRPSRRPAAVLGAAIDAIVCASELEAARVRREVPARAGRLRVVRPGVDAEGLWRAEPMTIQRAVVLGVGPLLRTPRPVRVVGAFAGLDERVLLVLLGDGPGRRRLRGVVRELGLQERVWFVGETTLHDQRRWMRTAAVIIPMCESADVESLALEAATIGKPLIVPDSIEHAGNFGYGHGGTVRVIDGASSPLAVADAIREATALHRPVEAPPQSRSWATHADELLDVYRGSARLRTVAAPVAAEPSPARLAFRRRGAL